MKSHKRLMKSLQAAERMRGKVTHIAWLATQPGSTKRGFYRGNFALPSYVIDPRKASV